MAALGSTIATSRIIATAPLGPSSRRFANAAVLLDSAESPRDLLVRLKRLEHDFGRRAGRRWGERVIDLDIILWSGGVVADRVLQIPHKAYRTRRFVLDPLAEIAPAWRDPVTALSMQHLAWRVRAVDRRPRRP